MVSDRWAVKCGVVGSSDSDVGIGKTLKEGCGKVRGQDRCSCIDNVVIQRSG